MKDDAIDLTIREKRALRKAAGSPYSVRKQYIDNMREYVASQNYAGKIQGYITELHDINRELKKHNSVPFIGPDGLIQNENYIDLDSAKVRIVALSKAIDSSLKMLDKVMPNVVAAPIKEEGEDTDNGSFAHALQEVEQRVSNERNKLLN
jgi:hypothetical protein